MKIKRQIEHRGIISPVETPCKCGGNAVLQEWGEMLSKGIFKRYAVVFCRECDHETKIYSERTANESRLEALNEWNILNRKEV